MMASGTLDGVMQRLRRLAGPSGVPPLSDGQLLDLFIAHREEAAFAELVRRHGPMVLGVCRRVLGHWHDADDTFQATFLVLARKARSIGQKERVGGWLYGVAYRTARKARMAVLRRRVKETRMQDVPAKEHVPETAAYDLRAVLDEELCRLPEKYRAVLVLCDLEGQSRNAAANRLGLPEGTLSSRLARGRQILGKRLTGRGVVLGAAGLIEVFAPGAASAAVPSALATATVEAVLGKAVGAVSAGAAVLAERMVRSMLIAKLKTVTAVVLAAGIGAGVLAQRGPSIGPLAAADAAEMAAVSTNPERIKELIGKLGARDFPTRQRADDELEKLGAAALPALREAAAGKTDLDMKRRVERLIDRIDLNSWRGPAGFGVKRRLERMLRLNPQVGDAQAVKAAYLLSVARMPTEAENAIAVKQLKQAKDRRLAILEMARPLVHGREFSQDLAAANLKMLDFQDRLQSSPRSELFVMVNGRETSGLVGDVAGKCVKTTASLTRRQFYEITFMVTLSRIPTDKEVASMDRHFEKVKDRNGPATDLLWALVNCNEFLLKR